MSSRAKYIRRSVTRMFNNAWNTLRQQLGKVSFSAHKMKGIFRPAVVTSLTPHWSNSFYCWEINSRFKAVVPRLALRQKQCLYCNTCNTQRIQLVFASLCGHNFYLILGMWFSWDFRLFLSIEQDWWDSRGWAPGYGTPYPSVVQGRGIRPSASVPPTGLTQGELVLRGRGCPRPTASDTHTSWGL